VPPTICYAPASFAREFSVLWTSAIAATLYISVLWRERPEAMPGYLKLFALIALGVPALLTALPALDAAYGPAGSWCWIVEDKQYWCAVSQPLR
jgi:hypothetical protein